MTFKELNTALTSRAEQLCALLLPGGRREGREWVSGSTDGEKGRSMKVVLEGAKAGKWKDFASDEGGDLLKLIELNRNTDAKGAADFARDFLGLPPWEPDKSAPPPFDPLAMRFRSTTGTAYWTYRDRAGAVLCHAVRFQFEDGKKDVIPMRLLDGRWQWKGYAAPLQPPIYGMDRLAARPDAPVLIVEGEKTADAAAKLFPGHVCITWLGGCKAVKKVDWQPVEGRKVALWPDADDPGRKAMAYLHQRLAGAVLVSTTDLPDGWDLADPPPEGFDAQGRLDGAAQAAEVRAAKLAKKEQEEAAKSEEDRYHLPPRCELSKVESDILKYKVFEHGGQIYAMRNKWATEVSNCTVSIHRHVRTKEGAISLVTLDNGDAADRMTLDVPFDVFATSLSFTKWLGNQGNFQWWGTDLDFTGYKRMQMDRMRKCQLVTELGTQPSGLFVFNNAAVGEGIHTIDNDGCFEHNAQWYYVQSASASYAQDNGLFQLQKMVRFSESHIDFDTWSRQMMRVFKEKAMMAQAFTLASAFSDHVFNILNGFPFMFYYGSQGGEGKDKLIKACQAVTGQPQPEIFLTGPNTDKGLIKMFAEFTNIILNLAEYRKGVKKDMDELLKSLWGRIGYRLAAMRGKKTETIGIHCTAMVSGNHMPSDQALMRRMVLEVFERAQHTDEDVAEFQRLEEWQRTGYSNIFHEFYRHRDSFRANWYEQHYKPSRGVMLEAMGDTKVDSAILMNMQVLHSTVTFFHQVGLPLAFTADELATHMAQCMTVQLGMRSEGSEVSRFWTCFVWAATRGMLVQDRDYKVIGNTITFFWGYVYAAYAEAHSKVFGERAEGTNDMRAKLTRHPCFIESPKGVRIGKTNSSAITCDMVKSGTNLKALLNPTLSQFETEAEALPF